jgi:glucose-1-phosphate thymidylyltransferase
MIIPVVAANEYNELFKPLTGGYIAEARLGGRPLYRYAADILWEMFGRVYVASRTAEGGRYEPLQVDGNSAEDAVRAAGQLCASGDKLLVASGSVVTERDAFRALVEAAASAGADGAVLAVPLRSRGGLAIAMSGGSLAGIGGEGQLAYGGAALIPGRAAKLFEGAEFPQALAEAAREMKIAVAVWGGRWFKVEEPVDLVAALELVMPNATYIAADAKISPTAVIEGPVAVESGAEIDHYAVVKGPAYIGRGAFVGAHALIRNFSDIEEGAVVGSSAEITHSLVGPRATIGRGSFVSYSVVGEGAVLEPNVLTKSVLRGGRGRLSPVEVRGRELYKLGALIGRGARVDAGTVLEPGQGFGVSSPA